MSLISGPSSGFIGIGSPNGIGGLGGVDTSKFAFGKPPANEPGDINDPGTGSGGLLGKLGGVPINVGSVKPPEIHQSSSFEKVDPNGAGVISQVRKSADEAIENKSAEIDKKYDPALKKETAEFAGWVKSEAEKEINDPSSSPEQVALAKKILNRVTSPDSHNQVTDSDLVAWLKEKKADGKIPESVLKGREIGNKLSAKKTAAKDALPPLSETARQKKISDAIDHIAGSKWGKTTEGKAVVAELRNRQKNGDIDIATQSDLSKQSSDGKDGGRSLGVTTGNTDPHIAIDSSVVTDGGAPLEAVLVHEGTHALDHQTNRNSSKDVASEEERAFTNEGAFLQNIRANDISKGDAIGGDTLSVRRDFLNGRIAERVARDYKV